EECRQEEDPSAAKSEDCPAEITTGSEGDRDGDGSAKPPAAVRTASPVPPGPSEVEPEVTDEVTVTFGDRRYRARGLAKNTTWDVLGVNVLASNTTGLFVDSFDLYSAKHRTAFASQAATELGVQEPALRKDLGRLLLKLEELQDRHLRGVINPQPAQ